MLRFLLRSDEPSAKTGKRGALVQVERISLKGWYDSLSSTFSSL